jgi:hypothetical protein
MKKAILLVFLMLIPGMLYAQSEATAYCESVKQAAAAQAGILRTPSIVAGITQPQTGLPAQSAIGLSKDLVDIRKATLTTRAADTNCRLYIVRVDTQERLLYALPSIEKDTLRHRLALIDQASAQLDRLLAENQKMVAVGNLTKPIMHVLESAKIRLDTSRTAALTGIVSPYVPSLDNNQPLRELVSEKLEAEVANQKAATKLDKQSGWSLLVSAGAHRQLITGSRGPNASVLGPYAEVTASYNLDRRVANRHFDAAGIAYAAWKEVQFDDVSKQAEILKQQITDTLAIQNSQLETLLRHDVEIDDSLRECGQDTTAEIAFYNLLMADKLVLSVDIGDTRYRIAALTAYLNENF